VLQLTLVVLLNLELEKLDVKTTFLHGDLDEDIYMEQLKGLFRLTTRGLFANSRSHCMSSDNPLGNGTRSLIPS
jgi:hypothetical protein